MSDAFRHVDAARTIVFGPDALAEAGDVLGEGYTLLSQGRPHNADRPRSTTPRHHCSLPMHVDR
jgi:hypothetical protein